MIFEHQSKNKKALLVIFAILLVVGLITLYWWQRGDALWVQLPSDTKSITIPSDEMRPADFNTPNVPRCYPVTNYRIVMRLDDSNSPLCITISEKQIVEFWNATDEKMTITFADRTEEVKADKRLVFGEPVGAFLAEGVHRATIAEQPDRIVEVYALTMDTLREACAHSEIPAQGEKDTAQDQLSPLVVVRWTDERGGENIVPLIYEPETDFAGCSESAKEFLRHLPTGPKQ